MPNWSRLTPSGLHRLYGAWLEWGGLPRAWSPLFRWRMGSLGHASRISWRASLRFAWRIHAEERLVIQEYSLVSAEGATVRFGKDCWVGRNVLIAANGGAIRFGDRCSVNPNCCLYGLGGLTIGDGVRIAAGTVIVPSNHRFEDRDVLIMEQGQTRNGIVIEDDVWIGANCVITDGIRIGKGSVIGAGSVVTKDIPSYSVAVGSPARVIRQRGEDKPVEVSGVI